MITRFFHIVFVNTLLMACLLCPNATSQDPQFSQFYASPIYLNPALTGNTAQARIAGIYRKQWAKVPGAFTSYIFSYDHYLRKYRSGVGLMFMRDQAGAGALRFTSISGSYSYLMSINQKLFLRTGARAAFVHRAVDWSELRFADQYIRDDPFATVDDMPRSSASYFDASAGVLLYSRSFWAGLSFDHITQPNESMTGRKSRVPLKFSMQGGYKYPLTKDIKGKVITSVTAVAIYKAQQKWDQIDIGAYYDYKSFVIGLWYRGIPVLKYYKPGYSNNDAVVIMLGYKMKNYISAGYSYDLTISKLGIETGGAHEISLIYEFAQPDYKRDQRKKSFMVPCTKF